MIDTISVRLSKEYSIKLSPLKHRSSPPSDALNISWTPNNHKDGQEYRLAQLRLQVGIRSQRFHLIFVIPSSLKFKQYVIQQKSTDSQQIHKPNHIIPKIRRQQKFSSKNHTKVQALRSLYQRITSY
uniref:Uncharacterized protein n=1 Tax=Opuntia streptacantha TaxID=393608 RepID=A0A7C8Z5Q6_OPUST